MHNKILMNASFYLLLIFAFSVSIYPPISYFLAAAIFMIWLLDILIFKETEIFDLPLFYPLMAFVIFMILASVLAAIYGHPFPLIHVALLSLFYMIVPGIVATIEQRRMVIWTFIAGAMLIGGLHLILWWGTFTNFTHRLLPLAEPSLFMVTLAFSFLLALYAESTSAREKVFMALVALPPALVVVFSADKSAILFLLIAILLVGVLRDLTVFIPLAIAALFVFSGAFGIDYYFQRELAPESYEAFITRPIAEIRENNEAVLSPSFFGQAISYRVPFESSRTPRSFLIDLLIKAGPPGLLIFLWVLFERAREAYFRRRRMTTWQPRAYHLIFLLTIVGVIVMNIYGAIFEFPAIILSCWLILGMTDI
jgi:hypothetical protein